MTPPPGTDSGRLSRSTVHSTVQRDSHRSGAGILRWQRIGEA